VQSKQRLAALQVAEQLCLRRAGGYQLHPEPHKDREPLSEVSDSASQGEECSDSEDEGTDGYKKGAARAVLQCIKLSLGSGAQWGRWLFCSRLCCSTLDRHTSCVSCVGMSRNQLVWEAQPVGTCCLHVLSLLEVRLAVFAGGYHPVREGEQYKSGRYVVLRKLGWGHFSTVWLVQDTVSGREAALKVRCARHLLANWRLDEIREALNR